MYVHCLAGSAREVNLRRLPAIFGWLQWRSRRNASALIGWRYGLDHRRSVPQMQEAGYCIEKAGRLLSLFVAIYRLCRSNDVMSWLKLCWPYQLSWSHLRNAAMWQLFPTMRNICIHFQLWKYRLFNGPRGVKPLLSVAILLYAITSWPWLIPLWLSIPSVSLLISCYHLQCQWLSLMMCANIFSVKYEAWYKCEEWSTYNGKLWLRLIGSLTAVIHYWLWNVLTSLYRYSLSDTVQYCQTSHWSIFITLYLWPISSVPVILCHSSDSAVH